MRARSLRRLSGGLRREVRLQVGERVGEARVVWLDLQQRLVTADRVVEPGQAVARGEVRCGAGLVRGRRFRLGGLGLGGFGGLGLVSETEGLGVGLPWTPPVAALAIVPTMSTANAMRMILSGFMGSISAERPTGRLAKRHPGGHLGTTLSPAPYRSRSASHNIPTSTARSMRSLRSRRTASSPRGGGSAKVEARGT